MIIWGKLYTGKYEADRTMYNLFPHPVEDRIARYIAPTFNRVRSFYVDAADAFIELPKKKLKDILK